MAKESKGKRRPNGASIEVSGVIGAGAAKIKKKIRDIERILKKDRLPADVRTENERAVQALKVELQNVKQDLNMKKIAKKYHMVRFFERKKAIRRLKQARKHLEEVSTTEVRKEIKKARKAVRNCEIDLAYVMMFPKSEKYVSLYPNPKDEDKKTLENEKAKKGLKMTEEKRRAYRKEMEKRIDEGDLPFSIEDVVQGRNVSVGESVNSAATGEVGTTSQDKDANEDDFFE